MLRVKLVSLFMLAIIFCHSNRLYAADIDPDPASDSALDGPRTGNFQVKASISPGCEFNKNSYQLPLIVNGANLAMSEAVPVSVSCTLNTELTIALSDGDNFLDNSRRLKNDDGQFINYTLLMSEKNFGDGTQTITHNFNGDINYKFYLKASANISKAQAGVYRDTVIFVLSF